MLGTAATQGESHASLAGAASGLEADEFEGVISQMRAAAAVPRWTSIALAALFLLVGAGLGSAAQQAKNPGPHPVPCSPAPCQQPGSPASPGLMPQSTKIVTTVDPHVLHIGQVVHIKRIGHCDPQEGSSCGFFAGTDNLTAIPCKPGDPAEPGILANSHKEGYTACFKATSETPGLWTVAEAAEGRCNPSDCVSGDYYTVNDSLVQVSGTVTDEQGKPLADVTLKAAGPGGVEQTKSDAHGNYLFAVQKGNYTVTPVGSEFNPHRRDVHLQHDTTGQDFQQGPQKDKVELHFTPSTAAANGIAAYAGETDVFDASGNPTEALVDFTPPPETPKALVCSATGRLYPQLSAGGSIGFQPFRRAVLHGQLSFNVHVGTEPGTWFLEAMEANKKVPASTSLAVPFTPVGTTSLPADIPQRLLDALGLLERGQRRAIFHLGSDPGATQGVVLALLRTLRLGPNFGPIHTGGGRAAIEFYDTAGHRRVLDTDVASEIADAANAGSPLPADAQQLPTLAEYEAKFGVTSQGTLIAQPDQQITYFGWPYPPLTDDGLTDAAFYSECVRPDALDLRMEVHSPVSLLFRNAAGQRFGIDGSGKRVTEAPGLMLGSSSHRTQTFILPAGSYTVGLAGTAKGRATIVSFTPGASGERTQVLGFPVRKGQAGSLSVGVAGIGGALKLGGHSYKAVTGVGLRLTATPGRISVGKGKHKLRIRVRDQFGLAVPGTAVTVAKGHTRIAGGQTGSDGTVTFSVPRNKRSTLTVSATAPGARAAKKSVQVR
jgi:hypothetical protein